MEYNAFFQTKNIILDHTYMFCNISIYYKFIKLFYVTPKDLLAQYSLHRMFKKLPEF